MKLFLLLLSTLAHSRLHVSNSVFVFGPNAQFDVGVFTAAHAPHLNGAEEAIMHWSGYYSFNPRIVVSLMLEKDIPASALKEELYPLYVAYYKARKYNEREAATVALKGFVGESGFERFLKTFKSLFPEVSLDAPFVSTIGISPPDDMGFPYPLGDSWYFNGIHTWTGGDDGSPMSSIDMTRTWSLVWGDDTSRDFVTAAHEGTVQVFSSCSVRLNHPNGFSTHYYHLDNVTVQTGQTVTRYTPLSIYANQMNQALCDGGSSTGPHVHVALLLNGNYYSIHNGFMSAYRLNAGRFSYDSSNSMYLERDNQRFYAYQTPLLHDGADPPPPPPPTPMPLPTENTYGNAFQFPDISGLGHPANVLGGNMNIRLITSVSLSEFGVITPSGGGQVRFGLFADRAGQPGARIAESAAATLATGRTEVIPTQQAVLNPGNYWLLVVFSSSTSMYFQPTESGRRRSMSFFFNNGFDADLFGKTFEVADNEEYNFYIRAHPV